MKKQSKGWGLVVSLTCLGLTAASMLASAADPFVAAGLKNGRCVVRATE